MCFLETPYAGILPTYYFLETSAIDLSVSYVTICIEQKILGCIMYPS